jgi:hypothetical protein
LLSAMRSSSALTEAASTNCLLRHRWAALATRMGMLPSSDEGSIPIAGSAPVRSSIDGCWSGPTPQG